MEANDFPLLIKGLMQPDAYPHPAAPVVQIETHISHVLLAGDFAYKLKKPLDLGFLDFATLERRRFCCEEELRLNRRLAADLYLDVVAIAGTPETPRIGGIGPVLEYAVKMKRFPQESLLDRQTVSGDLMTRLAETVADFHADIPAADPLDPFGSPARVLAPMLDNLRRVRQTFPEHQAQLERLEDWTRTRHDRLTAIIERRRQQGCVRECHGDMHRGNIALVDGEIRIFDAIEFNPDLRWIDTASEIAFLVMDLEQAGETVCARIFLNRYLERSGDYGALAVLDFYKVYRALVRAKVLAIRLGQSDLDPAAACVARDDCLRYLTLAESYTRPRPAHLLIACGLSGSGKSRLSLQLREALPLIHLRSDVERRRLFGLHETARSLAHIDSGIYFPRATDWTYDRLYRLADAALASGYDVLVDATFITRSRRERFLHLAHRRGAAFAILALDAPLDVLRQRVQQRLAAGTDASEADLAVLERQYAGQERLSDEERLHAILIDTSRTPPFHEILRQIKTALGLDADAPSIASRNKKQRLAGLKDS